MEVKKPGNGWGEEDVQVYGLTDVLVANEHLGFDF